MNQPLETYWREQPWIVLTYERTDEEADACGLMAVMTECCICGTRKRFEFPIVPKGHDNPEAFYEKSKAEAESYFRDHHLHPDLNKKPAALFWARPLRNPDAQRIDWPQIGERIIGDIKGQQGPKS